MTKIINVFLSIMIGYFVYVNLNDPDPILWVMIYGVVGLVLLLRVFNLFHRQGTFILMVVIGIYSMTYLPYVLDWLRSNYHGELFGEMVETKPYIEGTREFGGLLIANLTLVYNLFLVKK